MSPDKLLFDEKMKKLVEDLPQHKPSEAKRREFIARLYNVSEEREHCIASALLGHIGVI